jgi:hypothetical protein
MLLGKGVTFAKGKGSLETSLLSMRHWDQRCRLNPALETRTDGRGAWEWRQSQYPSPQTPNLQCFLIDVIKK